MEQVKILIKSIFAGLCIAIAALVFLNVGGGIAGAALFTTGLLTILTFEFKLYTGAVGYISTRQDIKNIFIILIGNIIGCALLLFFNVPAAAGLIAAKLSTSWGIVFLKSIVCGFLMYIAVEAFKKNKPYLTVLGVISFILFGAEHSIANICFWFAAGAFSFGGLIFILVNIAGNAIGAIATHNLIKYVKDEIK